MYFFPFHYTPKLYIFSFLLYVFCLNIPHCHLDDLILSVKLTLVPAFTSLSPPGSHILYSHPSPPAIPYLGQVESSIWCPGGEQHVICEEEHLPHCVLLRLFKGGAEGAQAAAPTLRLVWSQHLNQGSCQRQPEVTVAITVSWHSHCFLGREHLKHP